MKSTKSELVSAVIPTRHRPELLRRAVLSALHQTYDRLEVIVVIDGDDPATEHSLSEIDDARLRVISLPINVGGSEARNIGVLAARGTWIAFLDDDDEWLPQKIAIQLKAAGASESALPVVSSSMIIRTPRRDFPSSPRPLKTDEPLSEHLFCRRTFAGGPYRLQTSTLLMRRETMLSIPFRAGLKRHQDWDWLLRASCHPGVSFQTIPEALTIFRVEDARPSVGRALDWEFSFRWAREMRSYFTPRAYSFFLATECISRATKSRAGPAVYARLGWEFAVRGSPTARSMFWLAAFACLPRRFMVRIRELLRQRLAGAALNTSDASEARGICIQNAHLQSQSTQHSPPDRSGEMQTTEYTQKYLREVQQIALSVDGREIDRIVDLLCDARSKGARVFFLGVGGGAGHAGHAVNDFRKVAGIECYAPTDNVSELTARINDDGWESCYANWLLGSRLRTEDVLFIFSVGGGCLENNISANIVESLRLARRVGARVVGVVGRDGGYTAQVADACVVIPTISADTVTAHAESFQAVIWHLVVSHPRLRRNEMKWEQKGLTGVEPSFSIAMA